jgi:muramoyltetrapeptide carboxypeptidase
MSKVPPFLKKGDTILIISTARARSLEEIQPAIDIIGGWGLKVELGKYLFEKFNQFAGTEEHRAKDLQWAIDHQDAKAILMAGGGYGTMQVIDKVNFKPLLKSPKWFIGYSDSTVIHSRLAKMKIPCLHATMAFQFIKNRYATAALKDLLFGNKIKYDIEINSLNRSGKSSAQIVGGNLSLIYALSGSVDDLDTKGKILFIEDLDEQLYHIDRMMLQLKRSGKLKNLKGLIVGGMSEMKDNTVPYGKTAEEIIINRVQEYKYPVCFNFPAGHIVNNMPLYLNKTAYLSVSKNKVSLLYQ